MSEAAAELIDALRVVRRIRLDLLPDSYRYRTLDQYDAYFRGTQDRHKRYDWDGRRQGYEGTADIQPGWFVPYKHRKPSYRVALAKLVVKRFTAMLLGEDRFPSITVPGDEAAEDFVRALIDESKLRIRLQEARNKGGACGTAVMSFGFVEGRPQVKVHQAKHMTVLRWADRYELRPAIVLKSYRYDLPKMKDGKPVRVPHFYARLWTEDTETIWDPIPVDKARDRSWMLPPEAGGVPSVTVRHDYGECPVYWAQNLPESDHEDGVSDYDGLLDDFTEINELLSATSKGTKANVDPTLVIHADPSTNNGNVKKGSDNAIFSEKGAEYLELRGDSIRTAKELAKSQIQMCLDVAGVVVADVENLSGAARSAAALKVLYQPMINQCDQLRSQYGEGLLVPMLRGMLRAAKRIGSRPAGPIITTEDGRRLQEYPALDLPPRIDIEKTEAGEIVREVERDPGSSERIQLKWPKYFQPTAADVNASTDAATKAKGVLISDATAVKYTAPLYGVQDVDAELEAIQAERDERAAEFPGPPLPSTNEGNADKEPDEEDEDETEG